jgi:microcompartment protein CcmL/EutN
MVKSALGLIEVVGLAAGIEAADAAVKAANIELIGYELAKGGGLVTVKLSGDVGAVKAAVDAGAAAAAKVNKVFATHVIPRPHDELTALILTAETVGLIEEKPPIVVAAMPVAATETQEIVEQAAEPEEPQNMALTVTEELIGAAGIQGKNTADICNLCGDPACKRKKGDPRASCLHFGKNTKEDE